MPDDLLAIDTPEEIRAKAQGRVCVALAAHCRLIADNLSYSIAMVDARKEDATHARAELEVWLDYEQALVKRTGRDLPRYVPNPLTGKYIGERPA